jgi:hypothetical protein
MRTEMAATQPRPDAEPTFDSIAKVLGRRRRRHSRLPAAQPPSEQAARAGSIGRAPRRRRGPDAVQTF